MPIIAIDFDGTIVQDEYPDIGTPYPGAIEAINELYDAGYCIIINSCRARNQECDMVRWIYLNDLKINHCNENCRELICKYRTDCRKISADIYIDDKSLLSPSMNNENAWYHIKNLILLKYGDKHVRLCE